MPDPIQLTVTTASGIPGAANQNSISAGACGPLLLQQEPLQLTRACRASRLEPVQRGAPHGGYSPDKMHFMLSGRFAASLSFLCGQKRDHGRQKKPKRTRNSPHHARMSLWLLSANRVVFEVRSSTYFVSPILSIQRISVNTESATFDRADTRKKEI